MNTIAFIVRPSPAMDNHPKVPEVVPIIDGSELTELVAQYEARRGFQSVGNYGGVIHSSADIGWLANYYLGRPDHGNRTGEILVLACGGCGETGCRPLWVDVELTDDTITWSRFVEPGQRGQDYSGLGPFIFDRNSYERAIGDAVETLKGEAT